MFNKVLDVYRFTIWFTFTYKWNNHIVVWEKNTWCYILDLEFDPEFSWEENPIEFVSWGTLSEEVDEDLFIKDTEVYE
jgi:hypothetical protein